jgi:DNA-3-methyladenine glycosylase I
MKRCAWVSDDDLNLQYHDQEWGVPQYDDRKLFELLILEGAQAGLSWYTILKKRENYRQAFDNFQAEKIARYDDKKIIALLENPGIVRNRLSFSHYIWSFVNGKPIINRFKELRELPVKTDISDKMSKDLKKQGFNFVGSTICYAFMQAVGMVNDHTIDCFRYTELTSFEY